MKKIFILIAVTFSGFFLSAQKEKLNDIFDKYEGEKGITTIKIAKPMFGMLNKLNIQNMDSDKLKSVLEKIESLKIMIVKKAKRDSLLKNNLESLNLNSIQNKIDTALKNYEELMTVRSRSAEMKFFSENAVNGALENVLLNVNSDENTVVMMLDGKVSVEDVNRIASEIQASNTINTKPSELNTKSLSEISEEIRNVGRFNKISVTSGIRVDFTQGNRQSVTARTQSDKLQYLKTKVENGTLKIYIDTPSNTRLNFGELNVKITAPKLDKISASGGASFRATNTVSANDFEISAKAGAYISMALNVKNTMNISSSSGSNLKLKLQTAKLIHTSTSGSNVKIEGSASDGTFNISSGAKVEAKDFIVKDVDAKVSSVGNLKVNATETLKVKVSSAGTVSYKDNRSVKNKHLDVSQAGSIKAF